MQELLGHLVSGALIPGFDIKRNADYSISISIPKDHPKADKLIALAKELATIQTLESGLVIDGGPSDAALDRIMTALRDVVDVDALMEAARLRALDNERRKGSQKISQVVSSPGGASTLLSNVLKTDHSALPIDSDIKQHLANILSRAGESSS